MGAKIPRWEAALWSYVSSGDGMHCPLASHCQTRQSGKWCIDDNMERVKCLLDAEDQRTEFCDCDFIQPTRECRIFQLVEMLAQNHLKKEGVHCPPVPTELVSLVDKQHSVEIRLLPLKVYHGAIWRPREGWVIQLKDDDISATKRFTLFHEAFHILAHCKTTPVFRKRGTKEGSFNELLANCFAICMLMPRQWVMEKWAEVKDLDRMAEIFDVPKPAMYIRLKRLGLI